MLPLVIDVGMLASGHAEEAHGVRQGGRCKIGQDRGREARRGDTVPEHNGMPMWVRGPSYVDGVV